MAEPIQAQMEKLRLSINGLEAQRGVLGDEIVTPALAALQLQLAALTDQAALEEQAAAQAIPAEERRLVTILFMDMVGSTSMAEKLDPEEWRQVMNKLHTSLGEAITARLQSAAPQGGSIIPSPKPSMPLEKRKTSRRSWRAVTRH